jgi:hypothetical protein
VRDAQEQWEQAMRTAQTTWTPLAPRDVQATGGVVLKTLADGSVLASGENPALTSYTVTADTTLEGITGLRIETLPDPALPKGGPGRDAYGHFRVTGMQVEIAPGTALNDQHQLVPFKTIKVDDSAYAFDPAELLSAREPSQDRKSGSWAINAMRETERLPRQGVLAAAAPFGFPGGTRITVRIHHLDGTIGQGLGRFRLSVTTPPIARGRDPHSASTGAGAPQRRAPGAGHRPCLCVRSAAPLLKPARDALAAAGRRSPTSSSVHAGHEGAVPFERPSYNCACAEASRRRRTCLRWHAHDAASGTANRPISRLRLARWLVDERNPLVARGRQSTLGATVRTGIVVTSGLRLPRRSALTPELLDWLATEFGKGWSQKAILRLMVTSSTYRQSSVMPPALPSAIRTTGCWPASRFRMEAEMVRDVTLAAGGLLGEDAGRASSRRNRPHLNMRTRDKWTTSEGEDRYRRSLYTFWRRTSPYPSFMTFDTTSRELCTVRRVRTNTPLQALTLLNDPASFEAARALAKRMTTAGTSARVRAAFGINVVLPVPAPAELDRLVALYQAERARYASHPDDAARVIGEPVGPAASDLAAWTMVANVLLNLDEAITKE